MPTAITEGIRISVASEFLPDASKPTEQNYLFAYHITITNESTDFVQLLTRHWIIKDAFNNIEEVRGEGVIQQQPMLAPGESFSYSSGCPLPTEWGTMRGTFGMIRLNGQPFDVQVPVFTLLPQYFLN